MTSALDQSLLIIVPTLDSYLLLPTLLKSLQRQSWPNWRLIFVDGPSGSRHRDWLDKCCFDEPRCSWVEQDSNYPYIFGAMSQGFALADIGDWLLFWGSDDWAAAPDVLAAAFGAIEGSFPLPDLVVCQGRYADSVTRALGRIVQFQPACILCSAAYRRALFLGATPPHQATLFGPGAYSKISQYDQSFRLSADLDYFLRLSRYRELCVMCLDLELVHMSDGGVSNVQTQNRLKEVYCAYQNAYGWLWWFPFLARYARRLTSLINMHI